MLQRSCISLIKFKSLAFSAHTINASVVLRTKNLSPYKLSGSNMKYCDIGPFIAVFVFILSAGVLDPFHVKLIATHIEKNWILKNIEPVF